MDKTCRAAEHSYVSLGRFRMRRAAAAALIAAILMVLAGCTYAVTQAVIHWDEAQNDSNGTLDAVSYTHLCSAVEEEAAAAPGRPPLLCAGCPHRGLFHVLHKLKKIVLGDIGCYTLSALPPMSTIDACLCTVSYTHLVKSLLWNNSIIF